MFSDLVFQNLGKAILITILKSTIWKGDFCFKAFLYLVGLWFYVLIVLMYMHMKMVITRGGHVSFDMVDKGLL